MAGKEDEGNEQQAEKIEEMHGRTKRRKNSMKGVNFNCS
jgi:hypothetical protein